MQLLQLTEGLPKSWEFCLKVSANPGRDFMYSQNPSNNVITLPFTFP